MLVAGQLPEILNHDTVTAGLPFIYLAMSGHLDANAMRVIDELRGGDRDDVTQFIIELTERAS